MSWFARSLVNSLVGDEDDDGENLDDNLKDDETERSNRSLADGGGDKQSVEPGTPTRGVKEDLSELTKTLTRQFWGVASFLAPPPGTSSSPSDGGRRPDSSDPTAAEGSDDAEVVVSPRLAGIRSDFAEIGGRFRSGISMLSNAKAVSEISKIASNFLPFGLEEEVEEKSGGGGGAVGVTDEVLAFATNISMHPETWLDFPLIPDEEDSDDFDMSNAQQEHALAVERLEPRLAALRIELCPSHMSEGRFWKIYFVLLHSRLNKHDAELLTTPQIAQARAMLLQDLQNRTKPNSEGSGRGVSPSHKNDDTSNSSEENVISPSKTLSETAPSRTLTLEEPTTSVPVTDIETEKHPVQTAEVKIVDKSVIEEELPVQAKSQDSHSDASTDIPIQKYEEDGDDWLEEETGEAGGSGGTTIPLGHEEDVSFSDLEDDDDQDEPKNARANAKAIEPQAKDSGGWVQLSKSLDGAAKGGSSTSPQNKESNDWLNVDDISSE